MEIANDKEEEEQQQQKQQPQTEEVDEDQDQDQDQNQEQQQQQLQQSQIQQQSDSDFEEVEPRLKYVRMKNDVKNILQHDAASCITVHPKFLCLGSHWGMIHLLDHQGNNIKSKSLQAHTVAVNQISIDRNGDFIASCSDDEKVFIYGLYSTENNHNMNLGRRVKCIAIDPAYYKSGSGRRFVAGDEKLVLYEKSFLSRMKSTVLCEAEGEVRSIAWTGHLIAWSSDTGVRVYDLNARCSLGLIKWARSAEAPPERYRCNLRWSDEKTLLIGWVDVVRICQIKKRSAQEIAKDLPEYAIDPVSTFRVDFYISGIAPLENQLVLIGCLKELDEEGKSQRPMVHVVEPKFQDFTEVCANSLTLRGYKEYSCNDYHLDCLQEENRFFIVSPKDIVVASLCDSDDRIEWFLSHGKFERALEAVTINGAKDCKRHTLINVGRVYLDHLLASGKYDDAGKLCLKVLGQNKKLWEEEVYKFARVHQLRSISKYLPTAEGVTLDPLVYEMVLYEYLKMDPDGFLQLVKEWSPKLYTVAAVVNGVLEHLLIHNQHQNVLLEALAILYGHDGKYEKALAMYLKLRHKDVFQLIQKHKLYDAVHDMIEGLMDLDADQAIQFFLEKNRVPPEVVVSKLQNNHRYLYMYLDALDKRDTRETKGKYHGLLVRLYADYARDKLLPLLRRSDSYPIQQALDICSQKQFYPEMVYLLGRIGNTSEALALMTRELNDMESAIAFCQEHDDEELWNDLINYSLDKPDAITFLLQKIGTYVDPRLMVQRIDPSLKIHGLKKALVKMMCDYNLQVSVQEGCRKILARDYFDLHERLVRCHQKGILVDDNQMCGACHRKIIVREPRNLVVFYCKHSFHEDCLPSLQLVENCVICNPQKETSPGRK